MRAAAKYPRRSMPGWVLCMSVTVLLVTGLACQSSSGMSPAPSHRDFSQYAFDPSTSPIDRLGAMPAPALKFIRELDERPDYADHKLSPAERRAVQRELRRLPPLIRKTFQERLLGIYVIDDFLTSGMTDYAVDSHSGKIYVWIVLHPDMFRLSARDVILKRENTAFIRNGVAPPPCEIEADVGGKESALFYILLHEGVHAADYVHRLTPYVEASVRPMQERLVQTGRIVDRYWESYNQPRPDFDFALRDDLTFYGFGGGPKIPMEDAPRLYAGFAKSPFASLYGSRIWAEDVAELLSLHHLTNKLGHRYELRLRNSKTGKLVFDYRPFENPKVRERIESLNVFYR